MYTCLKKTIISTILLLLLVALGSAVCFADTPPAEDTYSDCAVYVNNIKTSDKAYTIKGNIYISIQTLQKYGQTDFMTFDTANNKIYFQASKIQMFLGDAETTNFIKNNAGKVYLPIKYFNKVNHVSLGSVSQLCKIAYRYENGKVFLYPYKDAARLWTTKTEAPAIGMNNKTIGSELKLANGTNVTVTSESLSYYKVMDLYGNEYYVNKSDFSSGSGASVPNLIKGSRIKDQFKSLINLVWLTAGTRTELAPAANPGIDVMSPIWLRLDKNGGGSVTNYCEYGFVELCHANGMKVWICANNNFDVSGGASYSGTVLNNAGYRNKAIAQYLLYACIYNADGINIDFESMDKSVIKGNYNTFVADMYKYCTKLGLTLSLDTPAALPYWKNIYDFAFLGKNSDYICPMTYEQHYSKAVGPGSTMDKDFYTAYTNELANIIGKEKVLMGVPFFTQVWELDKNGNVTDMTAITMKRAVDWVKENKATVTWDEATGQYIAQCTTSSGTIKKVWLEDTRSMATKLKYVKEAGLGGTACWVYGQNTGDILNVFAEVYKKGTDPLSIKGYW